MKLIAIKDTKATVYLNPQSFSNVDVAKRAISIAVNDKSESPLVKYSEDFEVWSLGDYDEMSGSISPALNFICNCKELKAHDK